MQHHHGRVGRELHVAQSSDVITYRAATLSDARSVGSALRLQDYIEAYLQSHGKEPIEALEATFRASSVVLAAYKHDQPISIFGVVPDGDRASPWMMATPEADKHPRELLAFGRQFVSVWLMTWSCLYNCVYAENRKSIRWLKRLGFTVWSPAPTGHLGAPFCLFHQYGTNPNVS